jgi:hypothetical protein
MLNSSKTRVFGTGSCEGGSGANYMEISSWENLLKMAVR